MDELIPRLNEKLISRGHEVELLTNQGLAENCTFPLDTFARVVKIPSLSRPFRTIIWMACVLPWYSWRHPASRTLYLANPLIVPGIAEAYAVIHDLNEFENSRKYGFLRSWYRRNIMLRLSCWNAKGLIAISKHTSNQIRMYLGAMASSKTITLQNGITTPKTEEPRKQTIPPYILTVGRLDPDGKNLWEALELFRQLRSAEPTLEWKIAGGIENPMDRVKSQHFLAILRHEPQVQVLEYVPVDTLTKLYLGAFATLFYSRQEGFGFPLLESFSCGCPVITHPDNQAAREIGGGLDIPIHSSPQIDAKYASAIIQAIQKTDSESLINHAKHFDWDSVATRYIDFLLGSMD